MILKKKHQTFNNLGKKIVNRRVYLIKCSPTLSNPEPGTVYTLQKIKDCHVFAHGIVEALLVPIPNGTLHNQISSALFHRDAGLLWRHSPEKVLRYLETDWNIYILYSYTLIQYYNIYNFNKLNIK